VKMSKNGHFRPQNGLTQRDISVILSFSGATEQTNTVNNLLITSKHDTGSITAL